MVEMAARLGIEDSEIMPHLFSHTISLLALGSKLSHPLSVQVSTDVCQSDNALRAYCLRSSGHSRLNFLCFSHTARSY